ncbi:hypothetical protein Tco_1385456 [Tanacetum coccineum]
MGQVYDSIVNLPDYICENSEKLKEHNQLLKLMQFLMGLDEVYAPVRSIILTTDFIPDVKGTFATLSRDESYRSTQSHNVSKSDNGNTAFGTRTNNRNNNWSGFNNQPRRLNRPNLVCTHYNMNGHTVDRCFELVGYPPNFKKNNGTNRGSIINNVVLGNKYQSAGSSNSFTDDQYKRLMDLISEKFGSSSMPANIVGFNCISFCSSRRGYGDGVLTGLIEGRGESCAQYTMVFDSYQEDNLSNEPCNDGRDNVSDKGKGTNQLSQGGTENTGNARRDDEGHPDDNIPAEAD